MFGLYIHWPFCLSKCIYCDFGSKVVSHEEVNNSEFQNAYCECCKRQLRYFAKKIKSSGKTDALTSIYFGGGTPSLMRVDIVKDLIREAECLFGLTADSEITLEANPASIDKDRLLSLCDAGVNRISLGVQSFNNNTLAWLGRHHTAEQAMYMLDDTRKIFPKWSFDLIYGLPKQTIEEWLTELRLAYQISPLHLSLYTLIVDDNTPLGRMVSNGNVASKTNDELAEFYDVTNNFIKNHLTNNQMQLAQYEVSNYSISKHRSMHNCCYWQSYDYIGVGAMAHGRLFYSDGRYEIINKTNIREWMDDVYNKKMCGLQIERQLSSQEIVEEILLMGLRMIDGIDIYDINHRFNLELNEYLNIHAISRFIQDGYVMYDGKILKLTYNGLKILDILLPKILL